MGNSDDAKVGDWVVAGIISALGRDINEGLYDDFLQIDAPINRGNSGGPTFNLHGQVIGINTAIYSPSGGSVGIGFAVPSNIAEHVIVQLKEHGHVTWGWLGVAIQNATPAIVKSLGLDPDNPTGALVASVTADSPAAKAGIEPGDVITAIPRLVAVVGQVASGGPAGDLGIQPGDVIVSVDQKPVASPENAATQLKQGAAQGNVLLLLNRHGMSRFVGLSIENNGTAGSSR